MAFPEFVDFKTGVLVDSHEHVYIAVADIAHS